VDDDVFDSAFPAECRKLSARHWTPVEVAVRAAELLVPEPGTKVLDVGSGIGKFCMVGALTSLGEFTGVEQRKLLFDQARDITQRHGIPRVKFRNANIVDIDWTEFDSFYFYNPFYEHLFESLKIDAKLCLGEEYFTHYVETVRKKLSQARLGTRVVTFHGFGGAMPPGFRQAAREPFNGDHLELWIRHRLPPA
jgi:hypothetical protein